MAETAVVPLYSVASIQRDVIEPSDIQSGTRYVGLEHMDSDGHFVDVKPVGAGELASSKFAFTQEHVLYGKLRPYLAKIARPNFSGVCSTDILPILPGPKLDRAYLCHFLRQPRMVELAAARATGANLPRLSPKALAEFEIPLPPLPEQRRIAAILDKADDLRTKRRAALEHLNGLTQSIFLEMFGDPVANPKGWPQRPLADVVDGSYGVKAGPFGSSLKKEEYTSSGYRIYGQEQVISGRFDVGDYYISERKYQALKSCAVREGDVLVSLVGSFGKVLVVPPGIEPGIINPRLLKITPRRDRLEPEFLASLLQQPSIQREFERLSHGGTMGILNAGLLKRLRVPLVPLRVQAAFIQAKAQVENVRSQQVQSAQAVDSLFESVQHRAFNGAL